MPTGASVSNFDEQKLISEASTSKHCTANKTPMESSNLTEKPVGKRKKEHVNADPEHDANKKVEKKNIEEPKPRIVLTFRTEKPGMKSSNMKIVSNEEKHDDNASKKSVRGRGVEVDSYDEESLENSVSPNLKKNSNQSESDGHTSDSASNVLKRSTRRRSKDGSDNILANAIARKERSYNETTPTPPNQRLSRRIKPTAKILANKELRIGLETQNNARLGIVLEKLEESGIQTRRSARRKSADHNTSDEKVDLGHSSKHALSKASCQIINEEQASVSEDKDLLKYNKLGKKEHLSTLGLKEVSVDSGDNISVSDTINDDTASVSTEPKDKHTKSNNSTVDEEEFEEVAEEVTEEITEEVTEEDDEELEGMNDYQSSEDEYVLEVGKSKSKGGTIRRSPRKNLNVGNAESEILSFASSRPKRRRVIQRAQLEKFEESESEHSETSYEETDDNVTKDQESMECEEENDKSGECEARRRSPRKKRRVVCYDMDEYEYMMVNAPKIGTSVSGDEGSEATCPDDEGGAAISTCFCEKPSSIYMTPADLVEPVFCRAVETMDDVRVGCSHGALCADDGNYLSMKRAGPRSPYLLLCELHTKQLRNHMSCANCGVFCTQGTFYQCSEGHLFHLECALPPYDESIKVSPGCPHCGLTPYRWLPRNKIFSKVKIEFKCSNKRIYLPEQREQCTQAFISFPKREAPADQDPLIPEDLVPLSIVNLKKLNCRSRDVNDESGTTTPERLYEAIVGRVKAEDLFPMIMSSLDVNESLESAAGGTYLHVACRAGNLVAVCLLRGAAARLDVIDNDARTPLIVAVSAYVDMSQTPKSDKKNRKIDKVDKEAEEESSNDTSNKKADDKKGNEELLKIIRYLVAAGCDVNLPGPEGMTALHVAAQYGGAVGYAAANVILAAQTALVDPVDHGGWIPLVWAAEHGHHTLVRLLLRQGSSAAAIDSEGNAVLHWCALAGHSESLRLLLDSAPEGAVDALNAHGDTPLHIAARQGHYSCVVILLLRRARTDIKNGSGSLAVEVCTGDCHTFISLNMQIKSVAKKVIKNPQKILTSDISNGKEQYPIPCVNDVDDSGLPEEFVYVTKLVQSQHIYVDNTIATMEGCSCSVNTCEDGVCACSVLGVRRWYSRGRLLPTFPYHEPPMLFECNFTCNCLPKLCTNSVVTRASAQGSMLVRAQVFRVGGARGWGLRATETVSQGTPVAIYCGELLIMEAADTRSNDQYMFSLDLKPDLLEQCEDKTQLCVDAAQYGSASRFINHSCKPNLAPVRVFTSTRDLRLPTIVLFATRDIKSFEEFTFDYGDKFWSVKSKWIQCECGSIDCRYPIKKPNKKTENK